MVKSSSQGVLLMIKRRQPTPLKSVQSTKSLRPPSEVPWLSRVRRSECEAHNLLSEIRQASAPHVPEDPRITSSNWKLKAKQDKRSVDKRDLQELYNSI